MPLSTTMVPKNNTLTAFCKGSEFSAWIPLFLNTLSLNKAILAGQFRRGALICTLVFFSSANAIAGGQLFAKTTIDSEQVILRHLNHNVNVHVYNRYAITTVEQTFHNPTSTDLDGIYHFQLPDKAAAGKFTVWIDGAPVSASAYINKNQHDTGSLNPSGQAEHRTSAATERSELKEKYNNPGSKTSSELLRQLLRDTNTAEHNGENFTIEISPLRAQQDTKIQLVYLQRIATHNGMGNFSYPLADSISYTEAEDFSFNLKLNSSLPVTALRLPEHLQAKTSKNPDGTWQVFIAGVQKVSNPVQIIRNHYKKIKPIDSKNRQTLNRNTSDTCSLGSLSSKSSIVVQWCLDTNSPNLISMKSRKTGEQQRGTFAITLTPDKVLKPISSGRDWIFVMDSSGSMEEKYAVLAKGVERALQNLQPNDRFRIINFNTRITELSDGWHSTNKCNTDNLIEQLRQTPTSDGTNFVNAMKHSFSLLDKLRTSAIVFVTDGETNIGSIEKAAFLELLKQYDIRLFTAVVGDDSKQPLLENMAARSNGAAIQAVNASKLAEQLPELTKLVTHHALRNIKTTLIGAHSGSDPVRDISLLSYPSNSSPSVYKGQQLTLFGHYLGGGAVDVVIEGKIAGVRQKYHKSFSVQTLATEPDEFPLDHISAYSELLGMQDIVEYLGDDSEYSDAITDLAMSHGLTSDKTALSFIASLETTRASNTNQATSSDSQTSLSPQDGGGAIGYLLLLALPGFRFARQ